MKRRKSKKTISQKKQKKRKRQRMSPPKDLVSRKQPKIQKMTMLLVKIQEIQIR